MSEDIIQKSWVRKDGTKHWKGINKGDTPTEVGHWIQPPKGSGTGHVDVMKKGKNIEK